MTSPTPAAVGIIGVGALGTVFAERLVAAGHAVLGYRRGDLAPFAAVGGTPAASARAVAEGAEHVILLLPTEAALMAVMADIAPSLRAGQVLACLASHPARVKQAAAAIAAEAGAAFLDGEVSGTPAMIRNGLGVVMIAGDPAAADRMAPVLDAFAGRTTRLATFGDAYLTKLVVNYLVGVHTVAAAEALMLAERLGLDPVRTVDAAVPSAGGSKMLEVRGPMMAAHDYPPGSIRGFLGYYDMLRAALADGGGEGTGPLFELTEGLYRRAADGGLGTLDIAAIHESLRGMPAPDAP